jgi:hypothetical protein
VANHCTLKALALITCAAALCAQPPAQQQFAGLETDWDIAVTLQEISAHADRLLPMLERIDARSWVEKGASDTYLAQLQTSKVQARALMEGAKTLAASPQRLSVALELFFRIKGLEIMLTSLQEGMRKYQSPADAQELVKLEAENGASRDRFQRYIVDLASAREQELQVMDHEAQRCRAIVTQAAPRTGRKK